MVRLKLRWPSANAAFFAGGINSGFRALSEHSPFKFRERRNHLHHHPTGGRRSVD